MTVAIRGAGESIKDMKTLYIFSETQLRVANSGWYKHASYLFKFVI